MTHFGVRQNAIVNQPGVQRKEILNVSKNELVSELQNQHLQQRLLNIILLPSTQ